MLLIPTEWPKFLPSPKRRKSTPPYVGIDSPALEVVYVVTAIEGRNGEKHLMFRTFEKGTYKIFPFYKSGLRVKSPVLPKRTNLLKYLTQYLK